MPNLTNLAIIAGVLVAAACSKPATLAAPTQTPATPSSVTLTLDGHVYDTALRPVTGATADIVDGLPVGLSATTDDAGRFSVMGTFTPGKTTVRASKEGYATSSTIFPPNSPPRATIAVYLPLLTPPVIRAGDYTMTFAADNACLDLPEQARTRTYSATIKARPPVGDARNLPSEFQGTMLDVTLNDASFLIRTDLLPTFSFLMIRVAGDYIEFELDPEL